MKRFYSFIMFMCFAIGGAWADSGLYIFGQEVNTTFSWTGVEAKTFHENARGWISYDYEKKKLTLDCVDIGINDKIAIYNKGIENLEIAFVGTDNSIHSENKVIRYDVPTTLTAASNTRVYLGSYGDEECIYSNETETYAKLTISGFNDLELTSMNDYCISHKYGKVYFKDSHVTMQGAKGTLHTNFYALGWYSGTVLVDCYLGGNYVYGYSGDSYDFMTYTSETKKEKVKKAVILRSSEYTGVRLNGEPILTSDSRWNASTNTLTMNASVDASTNYTYPGAITVEKEGVTIDGGNYSFVGNRYGLYHSYSNSRPTSIRNITLKGPFAGLFGYNKANIGEAVNIYGSTYGIRGGYITFSPSSNQVVTIQPLNGSSSFQDMAIYVKSIQLDECDITTPQGGAVKDTTIVSGNTPWAYQTVIKGWEKYDLYVNGTQVNEKNRDNLASLLADDATGTLQFDPSTNILTMNNLKADLSRANETSIPIYSRFGMGGLRINANGINEITTSSQSNYAIYSGGDLTISGTTNPKQLTLKGSPKHAFIQAGKPTISKVTLNIEGDGNQLGIYNNVANACGSIQLVQMSIKGTSKPLAGMWETDDRTCGNIPDSDQDITINPSTHELVYCDNYGPTTIPVIDDVSISNMRYDLKLNGNEVQSYTPENGTISFDVFSNRLYVRRVNGIASLETDLATLKIHTIGNCTLRSSNSVLSAKIGTLTFQGPGILSLNSDENDAVIITRNSSMGSTIIINNTQLKLKGTNGMVFNWIKPTNGQPILAKLFVTGSKLDISSTGAALSGFGSYELKNCSLYSPEGGYLSDKVFRNVDGSVAADLLILPDDVEVVTFDAYQDNEEFIFNHYGKEAFYVINNLTIKGDGTWRTICLPFNVKRIGSVLQDCDIREFKISTESKSLPGIEVLDFTTSVIDLKANKPYIIRNTSGTDIVNPNFGFVKLEGREQELSWGVSLGGTLTRAFAGSYTIRNVSQAYVLEEGSMELVNKKRFTADAFEALFYFDDEEENESKVVYTGTSEDDLIDAIQTVDAGLDADGATYDLSGRRVNKPTQPGLYIVNGKKIAIK